MEQEIILEGIHAMLEEIRDDMKRKPEQKMINSRLAIIEKTCNDLAEKKLVTEDIMASFISYVFKQMIEMNKKQDEKIEKLKEYILEHHKFMKEQVIIQQKETNAKLGPIEDFLKKQQVKQGFFERFKQWIKTV